MRSKSKLLIMILILISLPMVMACSLQGLAMEVVPETEVMAKKVSLEEEIVEEAQEVLVEEAIEEAENTEEDMEKTEEEEAETDKEETEKQEEKKEVNIDKKEVKKEAPKPKEANRSGSSTRAKSVDKPVTKETTYEEVKVEEKVEPKEEAKPVEEKPVEKEKPAPVPEPAAPKYAANTIYFNGKSVKYKNGGMSQAQKIIDTSNYASTWGGAPVFSGTDNLHTNFIQHNPGVFAGIWKANEFIVTDGNGTPFTYRKTAVYEVDSNGITKDGVDKYYRINSAGKSGHNEERVTFFTCVTGNNSRRTVVEASLVK